MHVKFKVIFEDNSQLESHDEMYNWLYDHTNALPPHMNKQWKAYWLISDEGHMIGVDFHTGIFYIKQKDSETYTPTHVQDELNQLLINRTEKQKFTTVSAPWQINNGLEYFPVVGRRVYKGDWGEVTTFFCGWKIKKKNGKKRTLQVVYHLNPLTSEILPEVS